MSTFMLLWIILALACPNSDEGVHFWNGGTCKVAVLLLAIGW